VTLRPHIDQQRFVGVERNDAYPANMYCAVPRCGAASFDPHHVWSRRHLGGPFDFVEDTETGEIIRNVVGLCRSHHNDITAPLGGHKAQIEYSTSDKCFYWRKLKEIHDGTPDYAPLQVKALLGEAPGHPDATEPAGFPEQDTVPVRPATPSLKAEAVPSAASAPHCPHPELEPGQKCECGFRQKYPKKESSPQTSEPFSFRVRADNVKEFAEVEEQVFAHLGLLVTGNDGQPVLAKNGKPKAVPFARELAVYTGYVAALKYVDAGERAA
jgi:hypothetical protein